MALVFDRNGCYLDLYKRGHTLVTFWFWPLYFWARWEWLPDEPQGEPAGSPYRYRFRWVGPIQIMGRATRPTK